MSVNNKYLLALKSNDNILLSLLLSANITKLHSHLSTIFQVVTICVGIVLGQKTHGAHKIVQPEG
jgi:Na+-translocating ferredoxin:NAD+ oxidoreductase RnfD subunit